MKKFMCKDFLLSTETAKKLYHDYASTCPIIDYHCHIDPREIAENKTFENITQIWLGGDHYKWRLMRACGVSEEYVTGNAPDREKFQKWAETLPRAIGNPVYHWSHAELKAYFGYTGTLNGETAQEVWDLAIEKLKDPKMSACGIIEQSNVDVICTTDDPADSLEWHEKIANDSSIKAKVLPAWRPDKAMDIKSDGFLCHIKDLEKLSNIQINSFATFIKALENRLDFFASRGCVVSDHGLDYLMFNPCTNDEIEEIFAKRLKNIELSKEDVLKYHTMFMVEMAKNYSKRNWAMQLHFSALRDNNAKMLNKVGANTGFDAINTYCPSEQVSAFLSHLASTDELPRTILYSLNPNDNSFITSIMACFQDDTSVGKIQHGSAWWFNDHRDGMIDQMKNLANHGVLSAFVGMLTDSRSFLSYTRHEYFRRILCDMIGTWVENGEYPEDYSALEKIIKGISYENAKQYFNF